TLGFGLSTARAQKIKEAKVPGPVKEAFSKQYQGTKVEKWEKDDANYEAEFEVNKVEASAVYDSNGNFIESMIELEESELPKAVTDYIASNLHGKKIKEAAKITNATGRISYKAEVDREEYIFDSDCSFVRKEND
ncbi:MAG: PepSY-like domain-containing protein, partial [Flavitalea sp.]